MALEYITRHTAAQMVDRSERWIDQQLASGRLTRYRIGSRFVRLDRAEVESLVQAVDA